MPRPDLAGVGAAFDFREKEDEGRRSRVPVIEPTRRCRLPPDIQWAVRRGLEGLDVDEDAGLIYCRSKPPWRNMLMVRPRHAIEVMGPVVRPIVRSLFSAVAVAIGILASAHAAARDYASRDVGGWTVAASQDGKGCFLTKEYDRTGETTLLLGLEVDGTNHLTVLNTNWSIKPKDRLELTFRLSNSSFPRHFAVGIASDGKQGFVTSFGQKFPSHFAASSALHIFRGEVPVERLSLEGSGAAVAELRRCVDVQRARPRGAAGKKEPSDSIPKDPFAPSLEREPRK
jgi:hypothetical protein